MRYNMAASKTSGKSYYQRNKKYREKLIAENTAKHKANRPKYAKEQREYYADSEWPSIECNPRTDMGVLIYSLDAEEK